MGGCCVVGCSNSSVKGFRMHRFPRDPVRTKIWAVNVARPNWAPTKRSEICNVHFTDSQYELNRADKRRLLKRSAVPTEFPRTRSQTKKQRCTRVKPCRPKTADVSTDVAETNNSGPPNVSQSPVSQKPSEEPAELTELVDTFTANTVEGTEHNYSVNKDGRTFMDDYPVRSSRELVDLDKDTLLRKIDSLISILDGRKKQERMEGVAHAALKKQTEFLHERLSKVFNEDQLCVLTGKTKRGQSWSKETLSKALRIQAKCGIKGYEALLDEHFPLPSIDALQSFCLYGWKPGDKEI